MEPNQRTNGNSSLKHLMETPPRRGVLGFFEGLLLPLHGWRYLKQNPKLWRYGWFPVILNTIITLVFLAILVWLSTSLYQFLQPLIPAGWLGNLLVGVGVIGLGVMFLALGVGLALLLSLILCGFFYGRLAIATEKTLGVNEAELSDLSLFREVWDSCTALTELVIVNLSFLLLNLIPVAGSVMAGTATWYYSSFILGMEFLEYPLSIRGWKRSRRKQFAKQHRWYTLGLGTTVITAQLIPVLGAVWLTTAVVGAVLFRRRLDQSKVISAA